MNVLIGKANPFSVKIKITIIIIINCNWVVTWWQKVKQSHYRR
jgi:hypothetical protein